MLQVNPRRQLSTTTLLSPFPPTPSVRQEKKNRKSKRKLMGQDKNSLNKQRRIERRKKEHIKQDEKALITSHGQTDVHPVPKQKMLTSLNSPSLHSIAEHDIKEQEVALWSVWVICPVVSSPSLLSTPSLF